MNLFRIRNLLVFFSVSLVIQHVHGQLEQISGLFSYTNPYIKGVKNVMGGVLGADSVHNGCIRKTLCQEFSAEVIKTEERYDPVKRSLVRIPKVVRRRGRLRWIGDALVGAVSRLGDALNINPYGFRRRQGGLAPNLVTQAIGFAINNWKRIPLQQIFHIMDMATDATNTMTRKGAVYPFAKSAAIGYGYGDKSADDFDGVCSQVAPDCGDVWSHVKTVNDYEGAAIPRKSYEKTATIQRNGATVNPDDPLVWNNLKASDITQPKVLLCKTGMFLEKLNENMGGGDVVREAYDDEEFDKTCQESHVDQIVGDVDEAHASLEDEEEELPLLDESEIQIVDVRVQNVTEGGGGGFNATDVFGDLPVIVLEGLPEPEMDQTEEDLVESVLKLVKIPETSVRTALRLPLMGKGKSLVLVELDTSKHREEVMEHKDDLRRLRSSLVNIGIRRAKYRELWKYVKALMVVKSLSLDQDTEDPPTQTENYDFSDPNETNEAQVIDVERNAAKTDNDTTAKKPDTKNSPK